MWGKIFKNEEVTEIVINDNKVQGVITGRSLITCDAVISTVEPKILDALTKDKLEDLHDTLLNIRYQGIACALVGLDK